jgi:hypothetical protein
MVNSTLRWWPLSEVVSVTIEPSAAGSDPEPSAFAQPATAPTSEVRYSVLSPRAIWTAAALLLVVGIGMAVWLLSAYGRGGQQLEAIRTAGTIVVGTGGAAALLLAARRQRSTEIALKQKDRDQVHQQRVAATTELDAAERRVTELYTKAADQLGSDKAPVRLAGLYALERLAQNNLAQRQTIVNVLCAYLRMPYQPPAASPSDGADPTQLAEHRERVQEREVRLAAQRLLTDHLRPGTAETPAPTFWDNTDLDLTGATLVNFTLQGCVVHTANFKTATFTGGADFGSATFTGAADFWSATFIGIADFWLATFIGDATFASANFIGSAHFRETTFTGAANFWSATFARQASFWSAIFTGGASFGETIFTGGAVFTPASFEGVGVPEEVARFLRLAADDAMNSPQNPNFPDPTASPEK